MISNEKQSISLQSGKKGGMGCVISRLTPSEGLPYEGAESVRRLTKGCKLRILLSWSAHDKMLILLAVKSRLELYVKLALYCKWRF